MFLSVTSFYIIASSIILVVFGLITPKQSQTNEQITCKDQNGNSIDWFYMYKLPEGYSSFSTDSNSNDEQNNQNGLDFLYLTSNSFNWTLSSLTINNSNSLIGQTVRQAFNVDDEKLLLAYNDEPPNAKTDSTLGHTKGLLMADEFTGFWLIHSVPLFPNFTKNDQGQSNYYYYPKTGQMYGQSFLCISVNSSQINLIGKQLMYNEPHVYEFQVSDHLRTKFDEVVKVATNKEHIKSPPFWNQQTILTINGVPFESFAKSRRFGKELYEDWVSPVLNTDLYVETWRHGAGLLPSNCTRINRVWNVSDLNMALINYNFSSTKDHSKWSVSSNIEHNWICVGDINRMEHQKSRGGGTVCYSSTQVANAYRLFVDKYEKCS